MTILRGTLNVKFGIMCVKQSFIEGYQIIIQLFFFFLSFLLFNYLIDTSYINHNLIFQIVTKHWAKMKNWMENQEDSLVRIKCEVPLNLGMGNYYLYFHCTLQVFFLHSALHVENFNKDVDQEPYFLTQWPFVTCYPRRT